MKEISYGEFQAVFTIEIEFAPGIDWPTHVVVKSSEELLDAISNGGIRLLAGEALDSHYGNASHGYRVNISPYAREPWDGMEDGQQVRFDVGLTLERRMRDSSR